MFSDKYLVMDPQGTKPSKDGDWEFPEGIEFPIDARVLIKVFKIVDSVVNNQTKHITTKVIKVEAHL